MQTYAQTANEKAKQQSQALQQPIQRLAQSQVEFDDTRADAAQLKHQQTVMRNSPRQQQLEVLQAMMRNSPRQQQLEVLQAVMRNSPRQQQLGVLQAMMRNSPQQQQFLAMQAKFEGKAAQREVNAEAVKPNNTGLPDSLKSGIESLSGMSMDHVKVHYNSGKPAQLNAHAYAQGSEIHVAPGQEQHLPHEAWHIVQQAQGRVKPTLQAKGGVPVNADVGLEAEADAMGAKALGASAAQLEGKAQAAPQAASMSSVAQLYRDGYAPNLEGLIVPDGGEGAYNYGTFRRPGGWYDNTLDRLFARAVDEGRSRTVEVVPGTNITIVQCESAGSWHNINDMQIGHIQNWRNYVRDAEPATVREATNAYNDLDNLRLEGPTANASHDFEAGRDSEDDGDMSDDDFIDKSDGGVMPPEARVLLDEYKAGQSSYYK
ncbi:MAG: GH-E family nuclease [Pseudomonadota bacterium]|jgi:hypothetical protein|uniref:GH-E family nuclease n=1 Tax=Burkholderiaceae TaxID=119060 RepID=UPI00148555AD|nr:GH-E family nuclease [Burkholderia sp. 4M9327F10]